MPLAVDVSETNWSAFAPVQDSASTTKWSLLNVQVYCDAPIPQIIYPEHATDDISPQVVKDQHLPYRLAVRIQDWGGLCGQLVGCRAFVGEVGRFGRHMVQVQNALDRCWQTSVVAVGVAGNSMLYGPIWRSRRDW